MALEQNLNLKLDQKLVMTPQLQLAIKLLQMPSIDLQDFVNQELVDNPSGTYLWILLNSDSSASSSSHRYFRSTEYSNPAQRPKLTVQTGTKIISINRE